MQGKPGTYGEDNRIHQLGKKLHISFPNHCSRPTSCCLDASPPAACHLFLHIRAAHLQDAPRPVRFLKRPVPPCHHIPIRLGTSLDAHLTACDMLWFSELELSQVRRDNYYPSNTDKSSLHKQDNFVYAGFGHHCRQCSAAHDQVEACGQVPAFLLEQSVCFKTMDALLYYLSGTQILTVYLSLILPKEKCLCIWLLMNEEKYISSVTTKANPLHAVLILFSPESVSPVLLPACYWPPKTDTRQAIIHVGVPLRFKNTASFWSFINCDVEHYKTNEQRGSKHFGLNKIIYKPFWCEL